MDTSDETRHGQSSLILGIGELLWDQLPTGARLGGAPANFTLMAARLGNHAAVLSRIGRDRLGREAMAVLDPLPVDTGHIGVDAEHETGRVTVAFHNGEPEYTIHAPAAWDFLEATSDWLQMAERADAICFGSLAQRSAQSRQAIQTMVASSRAECLRVFDVNLRPPCYSAEIVEESLELATVLKLNETEVPAVLRLLGMAAVEDGGIEGLRAGAERLLEEFPGLNLVAITRGAEGSLMVGRKQWNAHPGVKGNVVDTIGAGDAFTAAMTHALLRGAPLEVVNRAGNHWGGWVASRAGAMPDLSDEEFRRITARVEG